MLTAMPCLRGAAFPPDFASVETLGASFAAASPCPSAGAPVTRPAIPPARALDGITAPLDGPTSPAGPEGLKAVGAPRAAVTAATPKPRAPDEADECEPPPPKRARARCSSSSASSMGAHAKCCGWAMRAVRVLAGFSGGGATAARALASLGFASPAAISDFLCSCVELAPLCTTVELGAA